MSQKYVFLLFPGVGLLLTLTGLLLLLRVRRFVSESLRAEGTVVGFAERRGGKGGRAYAPIVNFTARGGGDVIRFTDPLYTRPRGYKVGQRVEVLYHWQDHGRARLASPFRLYFLPALLGLMGLIFAAAGSAVFWLNP